MAFSLPNLLMVMIWEIVMKCYQLGMEVFHAMDHDGTFSFSIILFKVIWWRPGSTAPTLALA